MRANPVPNPAENRVGQNQVWFTPNIGSVDMLDLFESPEQWATARSNTQVFKFYMTQVGSDGWSCTALPHANCGENHLQNLIEHDAFAKLDSWGIDIALGVIVTDINWDAQLWEEGEYDDAAYFSRTMEWVDELSPLANSIDHFVFQSWILPYYTTGPGPNQIPTNLPDDDLALATHTRLITTAVPILQGETAVPAVSIWGMIAMSLLMLTLITLIYRRLPAPVPRSQPGTSGSARHRWSG